MAGANCQAWCTVPLSTLCTVRELPVQQIWRPVWPLVSVSDCLTVRA